MSYKINSENNYSIRVHDLLVDHSIKMRNGNEWTDFGGSKVYHKLVSATDFAVVDNIFSTATGTCKRYKLENNETILFKCNLKYDTWYAVFFNGDMDHVLDVNIFSNSSGDAVSQVLKTNLENKIETGSTLVPQYSDLFKIVGSGKTNANDFNGFLIIKKITNDYTTTPEAIEQQL